jgi:hypothetical protein
MPATEFNMRVAVARFVGRNEKEPTQALINLIFIIVFVMPTGVMRKAM